MRSYGVVFEILEFEVSFTVGFPNPRNNLVIPRWGVQIFGGIPKG